MMRKILRSFIRFVHLIPGGHSLGSILLMPLSEEIVAVTKKKISNKKAMSTIDPALTSGINFECLMIMDFMLM
ncbi:hypothetical protein GCM10023314_06510 [Algibacter agarivorans]|uniref:Uncharacterized protein n=1 Tax=Algibacter agarivorans TaxID=1109741 RepID=A0ABP9GBN5_9FLAO